MPTKEIVGEHYAHGALLEAIKSGMAELGKSEANITLEDLGPVEEFHVGGRAASAHFLDQLELVAEDRVLDVGCGLGGVSRFTADRYGCHVTGIDLTKEYVQTGLVMNKWVGLQNRVQFEIGNATELQKPDASFDTAYMMHVGMNIPDKHQLAQELYRVLKPGGLLGIYDIMRTSEEEVTFPMPWASDPDGSALAYANEYRTALESAGFRVTRENGRREFANEFFKEIRAANQINEGPAPLGLHIVMGSNAPLKLSNMVSAIENQLVAPTELFAERPNS